jgi:hypothetical protein
MAFLAKSLLSNADKAAMGKMPSLYGFDSARVCVVVTEIPLRYLDRPGRREAVKIQLNSLGDRCRYTIHFPTGMGGVMSKFERLLEAGSTELPDCRCAAEMNLMAIVPMAGGDTEIPQQGRTVLLCQSRWSRAR